MKIYSYLNLPDFKEIPNTESFKIVSYDNTQELKARNVPNSILNPFNVEMGVCGYIRTTADTAYNEYVFSLIPELRDNITEIGFQKIMNQTKHPNGSQVVPHTDGKRGKFCVHWTLTTGGENVTTYWWQEKNQPVVREPWVLRWYPHLVEIDKFVWKQDRWGAFRADIIHNVIPVFSDRIAFTIGFNSEELFYHIIEKYGIES
jgi:hypothetical protein